MKYFYFLFFIIIITISIIYSVIEICDIVQNDLEHWRKLIYYGINLPYLLAIGYFLCKYFFRYVRGESIEEETEDDSTNSGIFAKKRFIICLVASFALLVSWGLFMDFLKYDVRNLGHYVSKGIFYTILSGIVFYIGYRKKKKKR